MTSAGLVQLGQTELRVSRICQGTAFRTMERSADNRAAEAVLRHALDAGINFFDSAYAYGWGGSEELLGKVLRRRRDQVVICTKVPPIAPPLADGDPGERVSFTDAYLRDHLEGALRRIGTDYIDLFLLHQPDGVTPAAQICGAMDDLVRSGKIRYWGVSNHDARFVRELWTIAREADSCGPAAVEDYYNLVGAYGLAKGVASVRTLERDMFPVLRESGIGLIAFSPLDAGHLAPQHEPEPGSPLVEVHAALDEVVAELQVARAQVCVAWVLAQPEVTCVLGGAECPQHVDEMVAGTALTLPAETKRRLDEVGAGYARKFELWSGKES